MVGDIVALGGTIRAPLGGIAENWPSDGMDSETQARALLKGIDAATRRATERNSNIPS